MLSVEKPPPDPPCQLLKHSPEPDERASPKLPLPELDLSSPPLHHHQQHPLPKFSIRDYVFTSRSKDIKTNWPFSQKNLQLCLKHGVKDVLPPFQPLDAVRNQRFRRCTVENEDVIPNNNIIIDGEPSGPDHHDHVDVLDSIHNTQQLNKKLADDNTITSCRSGENDFPSTTTSVCQSEIEDHSVPTNRSTSSPLQTDTSLEAEPEPAGPRLSHKTQTTTRTSAKKCRLIVKFGSHSDRSSTEDIASNCTNLSETMASKICPVCKTFSSSSNTTLNAHIDQCLSVESTPKWTVDSKLTRHRIKPRKTKLMVDIYATAKNCTLEDLDRRNGSNWATVSSLSVQQSDKSEIPMEVTKQQVSPAPSDHHTSVDVGAVYIDANGIKLRILSKSDDAPSVSKVIEHLRPRKPMKGAKGSKFVSTRKKKRRAYKYNKYLKLAQSKKLLSTKSRSSQILGCQGKQYGAEGSLEKEQKQVNSCNSGTLRHWACSKRTGLPKKFNNKVNHQQLLQCKWHVSEDFRVESDQSRLDQNSEEELMDLTGNPDSSPENCDILEKVFYEARDSDKGEQAPGIKRAKVSSSGATVRGYVDKSLTPMKQNARQLRKEKTCVNDYLMLKPPKSTTICTPVPSPIDNADPPPGICTKLSRSCHSSRSKATKISSARKNVLSSRRTPVTESKFDVTNKFSALKKSQVHLTTEIDEEVVPWDSESDRPYDFHHNFSANQSGRENINHETSHRRSTGLEVRQNTGALGVAGRNEAMVSESSHMSSQCYLHDEVENIDSSTLDKDDDVGPTHGDPQCSMNDIVPQQSCKRASRETLASWHKSGDPELSKLGSRSKILSNSLQYKGPLCEVEVLTGSAGPSFVGGQETFYSDQLANGMHVRNVNQGGEQESEDGQGSCFPDVDPILIPGPPGSFLPSPRDMGSEDFQGNSSLTTSRVQSSQDQHDFIDGDSSDSPISATSTISNPTASRDDHKRSELLPSVGHQAVQDKIRSSLSGGSVDSSIENVAVIPQTANSVPERLTFDREKFKVNNKIPISFKSDDEPCCCQRKERASQGVILNYQESQLLRRRAMTPVILEKQTSCNLNNRPSNAEPRSDVFSPSSCPTSKSEQVVLPVINCSTSQNILRGSSADAVAKFSGRSDCDSMSPSSNSILRLMGKNLMVVNRDQDASMPLGQAQPQPQVNHLTSPFPTFSSVSPSSIQNQVYNPFRPNFHQGSVILGQDPHNAERQCVDARVSNSVRSHASPRTSQMLCQGAACSFPNQHMDSGFVAPMEFREFKADYSAGTPQKKFKNGPTSMGHMERFITIPDHQHKNVLSAANPTKEIITIDDVAETEADLAGEVAKYSRGLGENHVVSSGIAIPSYNATRATPFYGCQSDHDQSLLSESPLVHSSGFHSLASRQANASPVRWGCPSDGSGMLQHNPYIAASSSRGHLRSTLYNRQSLM